MTHRKSFLQYLNLTLLVCCFLIPGIQNSFAQQNVNYRANIVSPLVNEDGTVTFKLHAPLAQTVTVNGDWEGRTGEMTKDSEGIWSYTTEKLPSDLYFYRFSVDGVRMPDPSNAFSYRDVGNIFSLFMVNTGKADYCRVNDVPHGNVLRTWYPSGQYETNRRLTVYTPPGYNNSTQDYPVLYLLHGSGGDEEAWVTLGRVPYMMDNLIADGTYITSFNEIVNFTDARFRTRPQKSQRAVAGLSMGGFHSLLISANHPDLFDYVGLFSPGTPSGRTGTLALDMNKPAYHKLEDKYTLQKETGYELFWIAIGNTDFLYESTQAHMNILDKLQFPYTYVESEGGHTWSNWRQYMLQFTPLLFN